MDDLAAELRLRGSNYHMARLNKSWPIALVKRTRLSEREP
jgi:hypothetical protein